MQRERGEATREGRRPKRGGERILEEYSCKGKEKEGGSTREAREKDSLSVFLKMERERQGGN